MKHTIDTGLNASDSKRALNHAMAAYKARFAEYNPRFDWVTESTGDFGFKAKGVALGGKISVRDNKIDVEMEVPFIFKIFQGRAMDVIEEQVNHWIAKVKAGEV